MAPMRRKEPKHDPIQKETRSISKNNYRPEERGSNNMKVTQLGFSRINRIVYPSSPESVTRVQCPEQDGKQETGNQKLKTVSWSAKRNLGGEFYEEDKKQEFREASQEAESLEIEIAVGCLLGSKLNKPTCVRKHKCSKKSKSKKTSGSKNPKKKERANKKTDQRLD
jgi:hypothetical protein